MAKSTKRRFLFLLNLLICFALVCCIFACGSGGTRGGDGTSTATTYSLTLTAESTTLNAGETTIITAKVTDNLGKAVSGQAVTFSIPANNSDATLTIVSGTTDANGQATANYTAGTLFPVLTLQDTVQASGAGTTKALVITRTGLPTGSNITIKADSTSLNAGENTIVTAKVTDSSNNPVSGQAVTFSITTNSSNATISTIGVGTTDANGEATALYKAGTNNASSIVQDIVQASILSAAKVIIITRTASSASASRGSLALNVSSSVVTFGTPVTVTATLRDADGTGLPNAVVTFAAASSLVTFTPVSATALTNASGVASISLNAASVDSSGATYITSSAPITTGGTTTTITSTPVGVAVNGAAITLGVITLGQSSISSYGTSSVSVPVLINGLPATAPISVNFTSACVASGKATLSSPVTSNAVTGIASSTYKDSNCNSGTDLITASVIGGAHASATITVTPPATNNIRFISATPEVIGTSTAAAASLLKSSVVKFQVVDNNNYGKQGVGVTFSLLPTNYSTFGITFTPVSATSDADGYVTTSVTSGTVPTPVWVVATVTGSSPVIKSQSNTLTITTGLPAQNFFSLSVSTHNIEGWLYDGVTSDLTVIASDRLGNPVPDGTVINFIAEGGHIDDGGVTSPPASYGVCKTFDGICTVKFYSAEYRPIGETTTAHPNGAVAALEDDGITPITIDGVTPLFVQNGRVTVLAYTVGEKSFLDANGNNAYDPGETFYDLGDLYIDANENNTWDSNITQPDLLEQSFSYVAGSLPCTTQPGGTPLPANYLTSPSKENTCNGTWGLNYVRRSNLIILSSSSPKISYHDFNMAGSCTSSFSFWLMDKNYNPMPAGTVVTTSDNAVWGTYVKNGTGTSAQPTISIGGTPVVDTTHAGGTLVSLTVAILSLFLIPFGELFLLAGSMGFSLNMLACVYALLPIIPMDGKKIYDWNKRIWAAIFLPIFIVYVVVFII